MRIVPRSIHPVSGEGVIIVVVAVRPGSAALAAALCRFEGRRIARVECYADAALAFEQVGLPMPAPGTGSV